MRGQKEFREDKVEKRVSVAESGDVSEKESGEGREEGDRERRLSEGCGGWGHVRKIEV